MTGSTSISTYSRSFSFKTWGSLSDDVEETVQMLRSKGFDVKCDTRAIGERGLIFKKTIFSKNITISAYQPNKSSVDLICNMLSEAYGHYSENPR